MTDQIAVYDAVESALVRGDISKLTDAERLNYYNSVCKSLDLNPLTKPFDYISLNGKLTLYARKDATDQLRSKRGVSISRLERETVNGVYCVTAYAEDKTGRSDSSIGAVNIEGVKGDALANAMMKAETKAKRRVTLSICGLGILDETETETIHELKVEKVSHPQLTNGNGGNGHKKGWDMHSVADAAISIGKTVDETKGALSLSAVLNGNEAPDMFVRWLDLYKVERAKGAEPKAAAALADDGLYLDEILHAAEVQQEG